MLKHHPPEFWVATAILIVVVLYWSAGAVLEKIKKVPPENRRFLSLG